MRSMNGSMTAITRLHAIVGLATLSLVLLACASATTTQPAVTPAATPTPAAASAPASVSPSPSIAASASASPAATAQVVESARHRYRVVVPPGWNLTEYEGTWETIEQFGVGVEVPGEDVIDSSSLQAFLVMNSMAIPDWMTGAEWLTAFDAVVSAALPPDCPGTPVEGTFAGEPAIVLEQSCGGTSITGQSLTHAGRGYYFTTVAPADGDAGPDLEALVDSITFLD